MPCRVFALLCSHVRDNPDPVPQTCITARAATSKGQTEHFSLRISSRSAMFFDILLVSGSYGGIDSFLP